MLIIFITIIIITIIVIIIIITILSITNIIIIIIIIIIQLAMLLIILLLKGVFQPARVAAHKQGNFVSIRSVSKIAVFCIISDERLMLSVACGWLAFTEKPINIGLVPNA